MDAILNEARVYIRLGKFESLQQLINDLIEAKTNKEYRYNFEYLWQKAYLMSCIWAKRKPDSEVHAEIKTYLRECYDMFDEITQMACKPTLLYGKYL